MKKTTFYATAMAVMLSAGLFCIVACQKDNEKTAADKQASAARPSKAVVLTGNVETDYANLLHYYWAACDSAYQANSTAFLAVCRSENLAALHAMTGLPSNIESQIDSLGKLRCQQYFAVHPEELNQPLEPCQDCLSQSLNQLGIWIQDIRNLKNDIYAVSPLEDQNFIFPIMNPLMTECERRCYFWAQNSINQGQSPVVFWCFLFCEFEEYFVHGTGIYENITTA